MERQKKRRKGNKASQDVEEELASRSIVPAGSPFVSQAQVFDPMLGASSGSPSVWSFADDVILEPVPVVSRGSSWVLLSSAQTPVLGTSSEVLGIPSISDSLILTPDINPDDGLVINGFSLSSFPGDELVRNGFSLSSFNEKEIYAIKEPMTGSEIKAESNRRHWDDKAVRDCIKDIFDELRARGFYSETSCTIMPAKLQVFKLMKLAGPGVLSEKLGSGTFGYVYSFEGKAYKMFRSSTTKKARENFARSLMVFKGLEFIGGMEKGGVFPEFYGVSYSLQGSGVRLGICMEVHGEDLREYCKKVPTISQSELVVLIKKIVSQITRGLSFLQARGVFPRDLKPENLLIKNGVVKFCDVDNWLVLSGLRQCDDPHKCTAHEIFPCMTAMYAPQEQFQEKASIPLVNVRNNSNLQCMLWVVFKQMIIQGRYLSNVNSYLKSEALKRCIRPCLARYWERVNRHAMVFCSLEITCCLMFKDVKHQEGIVKQFIDNGLFSFGNPAVRPTPDDACKKVHEIINSLSA